MEKTKVIWPLAILANMIVIPIFAVLMLIVVMGMTIGYFVDKVITLIPARKFKAITLIIVLALMASCSAYKAVDCPKGSYWDTGGHSYQVWKHKHPGK